ncbi:MAG: peroxiredoxin [Anaerolineae bacterium]|nr:peroxiredoxin [Anaerolineae bacterium]
MPHNGDRAPDFTLLNQDGAAIRLSQFRGRKVAIFVFTRANTMTCNVQACGFRDEFARFQAANAVVLGISTGTPDSLREWKARHKLPYDLLSDPDHIFIEAWGAWGMSVAHLIKLPAATRSYWVIDEDGVVLDGQVGVGPGESLARALQVIERTRVPG